MPSVWGRSILLLKIDFCTEVFSDMSPGSSSCPTYSTLETLNLELKLTGESPGQLAHLSIKCLFERSSKFRSGPKLLQRFLKRKLMLLWRVSLWRVSIVKNMYPNWSFLKTPFLQKENEVT